MKNFSREDAAAQLNAMAPEETTQEQPKQLLVEEVIDTGDGHPFDEMATQQQQEESAEPIQEEVAPEPKKAKESWKELRERAERAEKLQKERDEYYAIIKKIEEEALKYQHQQAQPVQPEPEVDYTSLQDDDIVDGKQLKRILMQERNYRERLEKEWQERKRIEHENAIESQLNREYPDLYKVLSKDNIEALRTEDPYLAASLHSNTDLKSKMIGTYNAIKRYGIYKDPNAYAFDKNRLQQNLNKPRASQTVAPQSGTDPLSAANIYANGLTEELREKLYQDMKRKARGW